MHPFEHYVRIQSELGNSGGDPASLKTAINHARTLFEAYMNARNEARTDILTQLPNYRGLTEILEIEEANAKRYGRPLIVAVIDFVGLKQYNDTYGHIQANYAIQKVAETIKKSIRTGDVVGRYTKGDEFCLVLHETNEGEAKKPIRRIVRNLNNLLIDAVVDNLSDENYKHVAISIGYTQLRPDETYQQALDRADKAMYKSKIAQKKLNLKRTRFRSA